MSKESGPGPTKPINYAAAASGAVRAAPVARPPPQQPFQGGGAPGSGQPPPRTASAPPEQQGMQQHLKNQPAFIPDKSGNAVRPFVPQGRPLNQAPLFTAAPFQPSPNFVPRQQGQYGVGPPYGAYPPQQPFVPASQPPYGAGLPPSPPTSAGGTTTPVKKKTAAIQILDPKTGKPVQFKSPALKVTAASFEPKKAEEKKPEEKKPEEKKPEEQPKKEEAKKEEPKKEEPKKEEVSAAPAAAAAAAPAKPEEKAPAAAKSAHGEVTRPGRWKPPADDTPTTVVSPPAPVEEKKKYVPPKKAEAEAQAAAAGDKPAAEAKESEEEKKVEDKASAPAVAEKSEEPVKSAEKMEAAGAKPVTATTPSTSEEVKPAPKESAKADSVTAGEVDAKKKEASSEGDKEKSASEETKTTDGETEEWELAAGKLGQELEERVADAAKEVKEEIEEEKKEPPKPEPIRYDEVSFNPLEDSDDKKKKYSKEFLMQFRPYFTSKPADLEDLDIMDSGRGDARPHTRDDRPSNRGGRNNRNQSAQSRAAEQWDKSRGESNRDRYGRFGGGGGGRNKKQPAYTGPPVEPLKRSESGWKPEKVDTSTSDGMRLKLIKEAQGKLNKLTAVTYEKLSQQLIQIGLKGDGEDAIPGLLRSLIDKVFEQALLQPTFCPMYAALCANISRAVQNFRPLLLNKCQEEFEADSIEPPADMSDPEKDLFRFKAKKRMLGNIKFICELFKQRMLIEDIMHFCIERMLKMDLQNPDEEQTEALCDFLMRIGKLLDSKKLAPYFDKLEVMQKGPNIPPRLRFMVEDVIDFRAQGWRTVKAGAKPVLRGAVKSDKGGRGGGGSQDVRGSGAGGGSSRGGKSDGWKEVKGSGKSASTKSAAKSGKDKKKGGRDVKVSPSPSARGSGAGDRGSGGGRKGGAESPAASPSKKAASSSSPSKSTEEVTPEDEAKYGPAVGNALDEYWDSQDIECVTYALEKDFPERYRPHFIHDAFKYSLTSSDDNRAVLIDCLFAPEVAEFLPQAVLRSGMDLIVKSLADLALDHPAAPEKFAPFIARAVNEELYQFKELFTVFDQHIDEGRGFGAAADVLGGALKSLAETSSEEKIAELVSANLKGSLVSKFRVKARNEAQYAAFIEKFGLEKIVPPFSADDAGGAAGAVAAPAGASTSRKGSAASEMVQPRSLGGSFEVPREVVYKKAEDGLDDLGRVVLAALRSNADIKAAILQQVKPKDGELFGDFDSCQSVMRAVLEYWLIFLPEAGVQKTLPKDELTKEAKFVNREIRPLLNLFCGADKSEVGDTVIAAYEAFYDYHGKEINPAFYMRSLQYFPAYKFFGPSLFNELAKSGKGHMASIAARLTRKKE